ncbi:MAG: cytidine/deoxycytidylate deaminase family protein [Desulfovibrio sp.]|nr:cytidine/deoxycytidylate deaminase family protein [Desulfovibrio sp.]
MHRLAWLDYFMNIAYLVSERSTCCRRRVGAVAVKDKRILATGYNGVPAGLRHCAEVGCLRQQMGIPSGQRHEICRGLHAEQNVIIQAAVHGINIQGAELYCTTHPCVVCSKMLINCGIRRIYYAESYPDELTAGMLREAGIEPQQVVFEPARPEIFVPPVQEIAHE